MKTPTQSRMDACLESIDAALTESARVQAKAMLLLAPDMPVRASDLLAMAQRREPLSS